MELAKPLGARCTPLHQLDNWPSRRAPPVTSRVPNESPCPPPRGTGPTGTGPVRAPAFSALLLLLQHRGEGPRANTRPVWPWSKWSENRTSVNWACVCVCSNRPHRYYYRVCAGRRRLVLLPPERVGRSVARASQAAPGCPRLLKAAQGTPKPPPPCCSPSRPYVLHAALLLWLQSMLCGRSHTKLPVTHTQTHTWIACKEHCQCCPLKPRPSGAPSANQ